MISRPFHVVVVGGGPAGTATAIHFRLANPNMEVALIDKASFPRDKACGDGLGPGVIPQLASIGIDISAIQHANTLRIAEVHGPDNLSFRTDLSASLNNLRYGATAKRSDFDDLLFRRAQAVGVTTFEKTRFLSLVSTSDGVDVQLCHTETSETSSLSCNLLVGADGANSRVRRAAGVSPNPPKCTGIAIRAYASVPQDCADRIVLSFEDGIRPGYGWCFPFADGTANVGVGMAVSDYRRLRPDLKELLENYLEDLHGRNIPVKDINNFATYTLPHGGKLPRLTGRGVALVGDAASMINPLSGEGIVYGLEASQLLVESVADAPLTGANLQAGLRRYQRRFRHKYGYHLRSNYIAQRLLRSRLWARIVIGGCSIDPSLRSTAIDFMFGNGRLTPMNICRVVKYGRRYLKGD